MSVDKEGAFIDPGSPDALERVLSAARYGTVGRLADSVTHDLNNMLGAAVAYSELIALEKGLSIEGRRMLGEIATGLLRGSALMGTLTTLTRADILRAIAVDAADLARQSLALTGYVIKRAKIEIETQIPRADGTFVGDGPRVHLALLHLLNNARESLEQLPPNERRLRLSLEYAPHEITYRVWDSGPEIPLSIQQEMFSPYYTTKPVPHLGLGLHAARAAAQLHQGDLTYAHATGFTLTLDRYPEFAKKIRTEPGNQ